MADERQIESGDPQRAHQAFGRNLARAFGGAVLFALPLLMTMEMWWLGFYVDDLRLALFTALLIPVLVMLSHLAGFEKTFRLKDDVVDAFVAYAVGTISAAACLFLLGVISFDQPAEEAAGKIALQAVPGSIGALLAQSQLGGSGQPEKRERREAGYAGELFLMAVGALFLALPIAPTEEMVMIGYRLASWRGVTLAIVSMAIMHAFVYALAFKGSHRVPEGVPWWSLFLRFTVVGYALSLLVSTYVLWTFGRLEDTSPEDNLFTVIVLGFPAAIGAAAARLIV